MINKILDKLQKSNILKSNVTCMKVKTRGSLNNYVAFIIFENSDPKYVIKLLRNPNNRRRLQQEKSASNLLSEFTPRVLAWGEYYWVEEFIHGIRLIYLINDRNLRFYTDQSLEKISACHNAYPKMITALDLLKKAEKQVIEMGYQIKFTYSFFKGLTVSQIHGDFNPHNIFITDTGLRIIDWEDFDCSFSILDIIHFSIVYFLIIKKRKLTCSIIQNIFNLISEHYGLQSNKQLIEIIRFYFIKRIIHEKSPTRMNFKYSRQWLEWLDNLGGMGNNF